MSCAKTAEPIQMQFGLLSLVGPENMYYMGVDPYTARSSFGVSGQLKSIVKHRTLGVG